MMFEDCGNCIAMEQSDYISEWQNLLLTLTSYHEVLFFTNIMVITVYRKIAARQSAEQER